MIFVCIYFSHRFPGIRLSHRQIDHYANGSSHRPDRKHRRERSVDEEKYHLGVLLSTSLIFQFIRNTSNDVLYTTLLDTKKSQFEIFFKGIDGKDWSSFYAPIEWISMFL